MPPRPLLLGHRGVRGVKSIAENTLAAFERALADGCDGFELDVRLARNGSILVTHDAEVNGIAVSAAEASQLRNLPRLRQVLRRYRQKCFLDIEIKVGGMETRVLDALREYPPERDFVVSSFLPEVVLALKVRSEIVPVGIICEKASQLMAWRDLPADYVIVQQSLVTRKLIQTIHRAERKILVWTVNSMPAMLRFAGWEVDGIISDRTQRLVQALGTLPASATVV